MIVSHTRKHNSPEYSKKPEPLTPEEKLHVAEKLGLIRDAHHLVAVGVRRGLISFPRSHESSTLPIVNPPKT